MSLAATIKAMAAAGCTADQIAAVAEAHQVGVEEAAAARRAKAAARKARWRANNVHACPGDSAGQSGTNGDTPSPKERSPTPPKEITPTPRSSSLRSDERRDDPKSILAEVLPIELVADVVAHRKALRSPLTVGAARGLAKAFADFGDPKAAAQAMMTNGWKGFKSEWMTDARGARAGPGARPAGRTVAEMAQMDLPDEFGFEDDQHRTHASNSTAERTAGSDQGGSGFAGRLSVEDAAAARRFALVDR